LTSNAERDEKVIFSFIVFFFILPKTGKITVKEQKMTSKFQLQQKRKNVNMPIFCNLQNAIRE